MNVNIAGIDKAELLAALYNGSHALGMGTLHFTPEPMTRDQAAALLEKSHDKYFDYVQGRVMKINLSTDELHTDLYDRDVGDGAAQRIIESVREGKGAR